MKHAAGGAQEAQEAYPAIFFLLAPGNDPGTAGLEIRSASKFKNDQAATLQEQRPATGCRVHAYKKKGAGATQDAPGSPHSPARAAGVEEHHHDAQNAHSRHRRRRAGTGAGANLFDTGRRGYSQGRLYAPVLYYC